MKNLKRRSLVSYAVVLFALAAILAAATQVLASGPATGPVGTFATGIACTNTGTVIATIALTFYPQDNGVAALTYSDPVGIPPNGSRNYFTPSSPPGVPNPFVGSAVVSSDQVLACSLNTQAGNGTSGTPFRIGTGNGVASDGVASDAAASTVYAAQVMNNLSGFSSYVSVQNTESSPVIATITFKNSAGAAVPAATQSVQIPAQTNHIFYQDDPASGLPSGFIGAATVTGSNSGKLAVLVNFYNSGATSSTSQFHSYNGVRSGASRVLMPRIVRNFFGYNSGWAIQNIGGASTVVTVTYSINGSTFTQVTSPIAPGAAAFAYMPNVAALSPVDGFPNGQRFGNAVVQGAPGSSIIAIVNEDNRDPASPVERQGQGATYNAIPSGTETGKVFFPQVVRKAGNIFSGGFNVTNTTAAPGTCNITYSGASAANESGVALAANGTIARFGPSVANLPDGFNSSVKVTCTVTIVGINNLAVDPAASGGAGKVGDSFTQNTGLNQ